MIGWLMIGAVIAAAFLEWALAGARHDRRDTLANLGTYAGYLLIAGIFAPLLYRIYLAVHDHAILDLGPWWLDPSSPRFYATWIALFLLEDFTFYCFHRSSHALSVLWASHVTHHSSRHFNLAVALRQTWTPFIAFPFWLPLVLLGFDPIMVLSAQFLSLFYQAFLHTELVPRLGPLEWVLNTPRHHRVHHGSNPRYVDKNFGGVLIVWDRLFGTFAELTEPVRYGIDRDVGTNPVIVGLHGWIDLARQHLIREDRS